MTITPRPCADPPPFGAPFIVAGLLDSPTGIGEAARLAISALRELGQPVTAVDIRGPLFDNTPPIVQGEPLAGRAATLIIVANPPDIPKALRFFKAGIIAQKRIVGFWHWELPRLPRSWRIYGDFVHEIMVPTAFVAEAVAAVIAKPIRKVVHPVRRPPAAPYGRSYFGLEPGVFTALSVFNLDSGFHRKNPIGTIRAFRDAFGDAPGYRLVLKTRPVAGHEREAAALEEAIGRARTITWLNHTMNEDEIASLMSASDVVMSLHRSEGFGLVPAQAMLLGVPVIATNWSSTTDFLTSENAALVDYRLIPVDDPFGTYGQRDEAWAEPDLAEAALWLKRLAADPDLRAALAERAKKDAERLFSVEAFGEALK